MPGTMALPAAWPWLPMQAGIAGPTGYSHCLHALSHRDMSHCAHTAAAQGLSVLCSGPLGSAAVLRPRQPCLQHRTPRAPLPAPGTFPCVQGALGAALPQPHTSSVWDPPVSSALSTEPTRTKLYKLEETGVKAEGA